MIIINEKRTIMDEKKHIRNEMLSKRKKMSGIEVKEKSLKIIENLEKIEEFNKSKCVSIFLSFNNEVDTFVIYHYLKQMGKKIVVPYTAANNFELIPLYLNDLD